MRIEPTNPRVLFFNDAVIAGWVRGGFVEFASHDPVRGMVFYRLDQRLSAHRQRISAARPEVALFTTPGLSSLPYDTCPLGVPGVLLRSVFPSASGVPINHGRPVRYRRRSPFERLWAVGTSLATAAGQTPWAI